MSKLNENYTKLEPLNTKNKPEQSAQPIDVGSIESEIILIPKELIPKPAIDYATRLVEASGDRCGVFWDEGDDPTEWSDGTWPVCVRVDLNQIILGENKTYYLGLAFCGNGKQYKAFQITDHGDSLSVDFYVDHNQSRICKNVFKPLKMGTTADWIPPKFCTVTDLFGVGYYEYYLSECIDRACIEAMGIGDVRLEHYSTDDIITLGIQDDEMTATITGKYCVGNIKYRFEHIRRIIDDVFEDHEFDSVKITTLSISDS